MNVENRRSNLEQDLRRMNQEYNEMVRKLSVSEATLEVALKVWYCTGSALICGTDFTQICYAKLSLVEILVENIIQCVCGFLTSPFTNQLTSKSDVSLEISPSKGIMRSVS